MVAGARDRAVHTAEAAVPGTAGSEGPRGGTIQLDGSHPDWCEGRGPRCARMAYIDDASSRVFARFYAYEGPIPAMDSFRRYVTRSGMPLALYTDKRTTYQSPAAPTVEEQLASRMPHRQSERSLAAWGMAVIHAPSPQAKGRVERLFRTFQDRRIKELRLAGVATLDVATRFVATSLPIYNRRVAVPPAQAADLHRPRPARRDLDRSLCLKTTRVLRRDWTVAHHGQLYQIRGNVRATHVQVEERIDGMMRLTHHGQPLTYQALAARPRKAAGPETRRPPRQPVQPRADHPWNGYGTFAANRPAAAQT